MRTIPAAAALLALAAAPTPTTYAAHADPGAAGPADGTTRVVVRVDDCDGCRVQLVSGLATEDPAEPRLWASLEKEVRDGKVAFPVPSSRTSGLSITIDAPWEGHLGYTTTVAVRYAGEQAGEQMTAEEAVTKNRASGCLEGTSRDRLVLPVHVEQVVVDGVHGEVPGTLAFLETALPWLSPMSPVADGVLGQQDVLVCR